MILHALLAVSVTNILLVDNPNTVDALCLPSGVVVHSGLLQACRIQDELALILSYEG